MAKRKLLTVEKDAEEIFNILYSDQDPSTLENVEKLEMVFFPLNDGADSDKDDAPSDAEQGSANIKDIGRGVLSQPAEVRAISADGRRDLHVMPEVRDAEPATKIAKQPRRKKKVRNWIKKKLSTSSQAYKCPTTASEPHIIHNIRNNNLSPVDLFRLCFDDNIMGHICIESKTYAAQKGEPQFDLSVDELYKYFGILLLSGYIKMPFRRMYWKTKPDSHCSLVSKSMSRNRFEKIHQYLHFNDNMKIDSNDKVYKIRPIFNHFNNCFQQFYLPLGDSYSLHEAMEPYYGHHSMKQFIRGKPIRYGFKFWCLTSPEGYLIKFHPYTGCDRTAGKPENLCVDFVPEGSCIFMDSYFTSLSLLDTLSNQGLYCVETIRSDRTEKAPLEDLKKTQRGACCSVQDEKNNIRLVRWNDNNQVTLITTLRDSKLFEIGSCKRWKRKEKKLMFHSQTSSSSITKRWVESTCSIN